MLHDLAVVCLLFSAAHSLVANSRALSLPHRLKEQVQNTCNHMLLKGPADCMLRCRAPQAPLAEAVLRSTIVDLAARKSWGPKEGAGLLDAWHLVGQVATC